MQSSNPSWKPKKVDYDLQDGKHTLPPRKIPFTDYHPLKPIIVTEVTDLKSRRKNDAASSTKSGSSDKSSKTSVKSAEFIDPLSAMAASDPLSTSITDPLSSIDPPKVDIGIESDDAGSLSVEVNRWKERRFEILKDYSLDEKLSAQMISIIQTGDKPTGRNMYNASTSEQLRSKLKKLDDIATGNVSETKTIRQQQFVDQMLDNKKSLTQSWEANQKVNALKIAIQCAKMLGNTSAMQYYPSKFVMITDLLEHFGKLVFERILSMCAGMKADGINPDAVPEQAKEICLNWMMKVASIRELLPRILTEASILPCLKFLKKDECNSTLIRLSNMTKGIGDPLVALYARTFLCIVGAKQAPKFRGHLFSNFYQFIDTYKQIHITSVQNEIASQKLDMATYLALYVPGLEWILSCISSNASENQLPDVMEKCLKTGNSLMILKCILSSFKPELIAPTALELCTLITESNDKQFSKSLVLSTLGRCVAKTSPPDEHKKSLLTETWKFLSSIKNCGDYMKCVVPWCEYASKNCRKREVNTILGDILKHLTPDRAFQKFYPELLNVLEGILSHMDDFTEVFSMDKFLAFLDLFQKEDVRLKMCVQLVEYFRKMRAENTADPLVINGMMYICRGIHDSVTSLSLDSDVKSATLSICSVIQKISFGRDFEQQLNFYVECRGSFYKLDGVLASLVHHVNNLSTTATKLVRHKHTAKTSAFVRACTAYSFITIPSIGDIETRLKLYLTSGQAALLNKCITQANAMFCAVVTQMKDFNASGFDSVSVNSVFGYICNFLSTLLTVPDHPEQGMLYLLRGLLNVVSSENNSQFTGEMKMRIYAKALSLLSAYSQSKYIYQVDYVDSNEHLYSSDPKFNAEISNVSKAVLTPIVEFVAPDSPSKPAERASVAVALVSALIAHGDMTDKNMRDLLVNTWITSVKTGCADEEMLGKILRGMGRNPVTAEIAKCLSLPAKVKA